MVKDHSVRKGEKGNLLPLHGFLEARVLSYPPPSKRIAHTTALVILIVP